MTPKGKRFTLILFIIHFLHRFFHHLRCEDWVALTRGEDEQPIGTANEARLASHLLSLAYALAERCAEGNASTACAELGQLEGFVVECHGNPHLFMVHPIGY
jgi:hypothetical protein